MRFAAAVTSLTSFLAPATVRTGTGIAHVISRRGGEHGSSLLFGTTSKTMAMFSSSCNKEDNDGNNMSAKDQEQEQNETQPQIVPVVGESTIRLMTRLAQQYNAVNLSQGFPNEPPPAATRLRLAMGILTGQAESQTSLGSPPASEESLKAQLMEYLSQSTTTCSEEQQAKVPLPTAPDVLNQYSPPMGRPDLRQAVADYYQTHYSYTDLDADSQITITLGATEAFATALRTVGRPGDKVVILEPFHELYPSQCSIFYLELRPCAADFSGGPLACQGMFWLLS
jgi:DNA-binding transcriptional MocR family regulator